MKLIKLWMPVLLAVGLASQAGAESKVEDTIRKNLSHAIPGLEVVSVKPSPVDGLYEVESANEAPLFVDTTGRFFVVGDLYSIGRGEIQNLSEQRREQNRAELIGAIPESEMVVFKPEKTKASITVFTDIDCGYCRKLHREIPRMNELGIQVNYVAFPRAGVGSESYNKMVSTFCADDRQESMTLAKQGKSIPNKNCDNPVSEQMAIGRQIGVRGTPAIVLESGKMLPGYVPADTLAQGLGLL